MDRITRAMAVTLVVCGAVLSSAPALNGQNREASPRVAAAADDLRRAASRLADRSAQDVLQRRQNSPDDIHDALLAQQMHAGATLLLDMVRGRRPVAELREVVTGLAVLFDQAPPRARASSPWRSVREAVADLERQLGAGGGPVVLPPAERPIVGRLSWRGWVDDRVHLVIRGGSVETRTVSGAPRAPGASTFTAPLPAADVEVGVTTSRGRGEVTVLQQPSPLNEYTAVVEIYDSRGGAQEYRLEIAWR